MQEELEGVREVGKVLVVVAEAEGGGGVRDGEVVAEDGGQEELGLKGFSFCPRLLAWDM